MQYHFSSTWDLHILLSLDVTHTFIPNAQKAEFLSCQDQLGTANAKVIITSGTKLHLDFSV